MNVAINNAIGLLEELLHNGDNSKTHLYAWFVGERELIKRTANHLIQLDGVETHIDEKR